VPPPEEVGEAGEREVEKKTTIVKLVIDYNETKVTLNSGHKPWVGFMNLNWDESPRNP
jgi:hypothetical protein